MLITVSSSSTGLLTSVLFFASQSGLGRACKNNTSHRMDAKEETLSILNRIWLKLHGLPNANPIELGAFFVILTFILVVLLMTVLTCASCCCCCCRKSKMKGSNI